MSKTPKSYGTRKVAGNRKVPQRFRDRNLAAINPLREQFEPTDAVPVRQRNKMAGGA